MSKQNQKISKQLAKCPFCGGEAEFVRDIERVDIFNSSDFVYVRCKKCRAQTGKFYYSAVFRKLDEEYEEAAKAWNTRIPMQNIVERLKEKHEESTSNYHDLKDVSCLGEKHAYRNAIEIVKEEGEK